MGQFDSVAGFWNFAKLTHSTHHTEQIANSAKNGQYLERDSRSSAWWALALAGWASFSLLFSLGVLLDVTIQKKIPKLNAKASNFFGDILSTG
jgi:hypothetical protein